VASVPAATATTVARAGRRYLVAAPPPGYALRPPTTAR